jgi:hypothetical protein
MSSGGPPDAAIGAGGVPDTGSVGYAPMLCDSLGVSFRSFGEILPARSSPLESNDAPRYPRGFASGVNPGLR